jgi:choline-sulfatase
MSVSQLFQNGKRPNVVIIITDQERSLQHWPRSFYETHLPNMCRLLANGLEFTNYFTNSCMCSPSRATLLTSQFPVQTGVTTTGSPKPKVALPTDIPNLATIFQKEGYHVEWHGKWHLGGIPSDYGFHGWQPPDAGNYLSLNETLGGGDPDNDTRFLNEICSFLQRHTAQDHPTPFLLVASFVNPHDVYVAQHEPAMGYTEEDFYRVRVPLPSNWREDPDSNRKPRAQGEMSIPYVPFCNHPQEYVNFYAYLHTIVDAKIGKVLDELDRLSLTKSTLILRTADHGEQGLSHSLVEKFYNAYEESIHIPLIVSNPIAFPGAFQTSSLASHVDLLPTLHQLLLQGNQKGATPTNGDSYEFIGKDISPILDSAITDPCASVQANIHFTYDDIPCRNAPSIVRCIRTAKYKYAVYFTPDGNDADWELYDLTQDPLEDFNLAGQPSVAALQQDLDKELVNTMQVSKTLPLDFEWPPHPTVHSRGVPDETPCKDFG